MFGRYSATTHRALTPTARPARRWPSPTTGCIPRSRPRSRAIAPASTTSSACARVVPQRTYRMWVERVGELILLAIDEPGWLSLVGLNNRGFLSGADRGRPRVDMHDLEDFSEGVIALTGLPGGGLPGGACGIITNLRIRNTRKARRWRGSPWPRHRRDRSGRLRQRLPADRRG